MSEVLFTFGVVPGVKLKELSGIVGERIYIDSIPQHNYYSAKIIQGYAIIIQEYRELLTYN